MKKILFSLTALVVLALSFSANAQWDFESSVDLQSRYVWRGQALGLEGPSVQPGATVSWNGLSLGVWGAYNFSMTQYQELDWTLAYSFCNDMITLQVTDYAFPILASTYHYFDYQNNHVLEAGLIFAVPQTQLVLSVFTNFYGADAAHADGSMVYSTYAEAAYHLPWESQEVDFDFALGAAFNGEAGFSFYGNDGFGIVNISAGATKNLHVSPSFELPVYARVIANPVANKMFLVCGATISL